MAFYGVNTLKTWETRYSQTRDETRFRTSKAFSSGEGAISLWLRQGELEAALMNTRPWDPDKLRSSLRDMLKLSTIRHPERFLPKLLAIGAEAGVAIVIAKAPQGCKASGASRLVEPAKAMILLSFRHLADDHFWFTLLHEAGHLLLHGAKTFVDGDDTEPDQWEHEADEFAASQIIPSKRWNEVASLDYDKETVLRLAVSLGIGPGLIVGQLQHQGLLGRNRLNFLKRRWTWDQITAVAIP
jgi:Zn-dependent peptidase ImmA (M78 family)